MKLNLLLFIGCLCVIGFAEQPGDIFKVVPQTVFTNHSAVLFFISVNSNGCDCMRKNSQYMNDTIKDFIDNEKLSEVFITNIPFFQYRSNASIILDCYKLSYAPAIVLADETKLYYSVSYHFSPTEIEKFDQAIIRIKKKK